LRHTFGTHVSKNGVPRTAQAAMRHSSLDLTMPAHRGENVHTAPSLNGK
jgi:integrase